MLRSAQIEVPQLRILCIDTDDMRNVGGQASTRLTSQVRSELASLGGDREVVYRDGVRFLPKLMQSEQFFQDRHTPNFVGTSIVTGGLGGLGLMTAKVLIEAGVRCVVLVSRSGTVKHSDQGLEVRLDALRASGAEIVIERCNMSVEAEVEAMLQRMRSEHGPLKAVIHAAGALSDGLLSKQDADSMRRVFAPKADGAWFLHKHTSSDSLDAFVLFSSVSALFGNVGQVNYAAANAYLDELARWRVAHGLPAVSIQWPGVLGVGMAAAMDAGVQLGKSSMISEEVVKQIMKTILAGVVVGANPVHAVIPRASLVQFAEHSSGIMTSLMEEVMENYGDSSLHPVRVKSIDELTFIILQEVSSLIGTT